MRRQIWIVAMVSITTLALMSTPAHAARTSLDCGQDCIVGSDCPVLCTTCAIGALGSKCAG